MLQTSSQSQNTNDDDDETELEDDDTNNLSNINSNSNVSVIRSNKSIFWKLIFLFVLILNPIIGQQTTFKKMPFIIWESEDSYIFDSAHGQKLLIHLENTCNKIIPYSQTTLLKHCNDKRNEMLDELKTFCLEKTTTGITRHKRFIYFIIGGVAIISLLFLIILWLNTF